MFSQTARETRRGSRRSQLFASTILASLLAPAFSATAVAQVIELPLLLVTSPTGVPTPIAQVPSSVSVITAEDIERDQRRTVPDALSTVPGLNVVQTGGPGGTTSVFMRGTNSNHVKVLIDGIEVSDPSSAGRTFEFGHLLTADIERIEVLRGPQSGLYGADAIGGVISITTKKGEGPPKLTTAFEGGSFHTANQSAGVSGSQSGFSYALNAAHFRSADTPVTPPELLPPGRPAFGDSYENWTFSTKLGANVSENISFNYVGRYTDAKLRFTGDEFDLVTFANLPAAAQSTQVVHQFFTRGEAVAAMFDGRLVNTFGVNYTNHWNWNAQPFPIVPNVNQGDRTRLDYRGVATPLPGLTFLMGAEQENETLQTAKVNAENGNRAVYMEVQAEFWKRLFLVGNGRADQNDSFGSHGTYRIAAAAITPLSETKFKASYGTGFKAPTLNQLFVDFPEFNFFANPDLRPEESKGFDLGLEQPVFDGRLLFGATYFQNDLKNLITTSFDPARLRSTLINVDEARTDGVEAFASLRVNEQLQLRADYTYTDAVNAKTGEQLLRRPRNKGSVTAIWNPIDRLTLSSTVLLVGEWVDISRTTFERVTQPGFTVVNVAANYRVNDNVTTFARIDNLFDERYENPNGFLRPGFGAYAGVRFTN
jgi:vitamin B12 transporter